MKDAKKEEKVDFRAQLKDAGVDKFALEEQKEKTATEWQGKAAEIVAHADEEEEE